MSDAFYSFFLLILAGILIKLERAVEGTETANRPDTASINLRKSMGYPKSC